MNEIRLAKDMAKKLSIDIEKRKNIVSAIEKSIEEANFIVIGPGDLYTSIIPVLLVSGVKESIKKGKAKIVYIMNLMTKSGQTSNYKASDHISDLSRYLGRQPDYVLINNGSISHDILESYRLYNEVKVKNDLDKNGYKILETDLVDNKKIEKSRSDILYRSILRHDSEKVAKVLVSIFE